MKTTQVLTDKLAIGLSLACAIHCLLLPILLVLLPSMAALQLDNEAFHLWMVIAVIPSSAYALSLGCKQHKRYQLLILGCTGVTLLVLALMLGVGLGTALEMALEMALVHHRNQAIEHSWFQILLDSNVQCR